MKWYRLHNQDISNRFNIHSLTRNFWKIPWPSHFLHALKIGDILNRANCPLTEVVEGSLLKMSAYAALVGLKTFFISKAAATDISNATFRFAKYVYHGLFMLLFLSWSVWLIFITRLTTAVLIGCSILTTSKQFFGDPIHCHINAKDWSLKVGSPTNLDWYFLIRHLNDSNNDIYKSSSRSSSLIASWSRLIPWPPRMALV